MQNKTKKKKAKKSVKVQDLKTKKDAKGGSFSWAPTKVQAGTKIDF